MTKLKKILAAFTLALFTCTSASVLVPAHALAASYRHYPPYHVDHRRQGHNNLSKAGKAILIIGGVTGLVAAIVGSAKHHKKYK